MTMNPEEIVETKLFACPRCNFQSEYRDDVVEHITNPERMPDVFFRTDWHIGQLALLSDSIGCVRLLRITNVILVPGTDFSASSCLAGTCKIAPVFEDGHLYVRGREEFVALPDTLTYRGDKIEL